MFIYSFSVSPLRHEDVNILPYQELYYCVASLLSYLDYIGLTWAEAGAVLGVVPTRVLARHAEVHHGVAVAARAVAIRATHRAASKPHVAWQPTRKTVVAITLTILSQSHTISSLYFPLAHFTFVLLSFSASVNDS